MNKWTFGDYFSSGGYILVTIAACIVLGPFILPVAAVGWLGRKLGIDLRDDHSSTYGC